MIEQHSPLNDFEQVDSDTMQQRSAAHLALMQRRHTVRSFFGRAGSTTSD